MNPLRIGLLLTPRFAILLGALIGFGGCSGYGSPAGGYMGSGGFYGMSPMGMGMGPMGMGMGMAGYTMGPGAMGAGYQGTAYGTGGMELGTNLGGWGEGTGDDWGHNQNGKGPAVMDNDPHMTSSYHNTDFDNDKGFAFYHPSVSPSPSNPSPAKP